MHAQRVVEGKVENKMLFKICQAVESSGLVPGRSATGMMRMVEGHPKTGRMNYSISSKVVDDLADGPEFRQFSVPFAAPPPPPPPPPPIQAPVHAPPPVQPPVALEHAGPVEMTIGKAKTGTTMNFSQERANFFEDRYMDGLRMNTFYPREDNPKACKNTKACRACRQLKKVHRWRVCKKNCWSKDGFVLRLVVEYACSSACEHQLSVVQNNAP